MALFKMEQLTTTNYFKWRDEIEFALTVNNMWEPIENGADFIALPEATRAAAHRKTIQAIMTTMSANLRNNIRGMDSAKTAWDKLAAMFKSSTLGAKNQLKDQIRNAKRNKGEDALTFVSRINGIKIQLAECCDSEIPDDELVHVILRGLGPAYEDFVRFAEYETDMTLEKLMNRLQSHAPPAERVKREEEAFMARAGPSGNNVKKFFKGSCHHCGKKGHMKRDCRLLKAESAGEQEPDSNNQKGDKFSKHPKSAFMVTQTPHDVGEVQMQRTIAGAITEVMQQHGHDSQIKDHFMTQVVKIWEVAERNIATSGGSPGVNMSTDADDIVSVSMQQHHELCTPSALNYMKQNRMMTPVAFVRPEPEETQRETVFNVNSVPMALMVHRLMQPVFDSGASIHIVMHNTGQHVIDYQPVQEHDGPVTVNMAGGESHEALGYVTYQLSLDEGFTLTINNALYVPSATEDLISVGKCCEEGYDFFFQYDAVYVRKQTQLPVHDAQFARVGTRINGLYRTVNNSRYSSSPKKRVRWADLEDHALHVSTELMHKRMGHPSQQVMQHMHRHDCVKGMPDRLAATHHKCDVCMRAKQARPCFHNSEFQATDNLELVHADVMGPFPVNSMGGSRFTLVIIDDYSKYMESVCLESKADVPEALMTVLTEWVTQQGVDVRTLRTDRGSEFCNWRLRKYMQAKGIVHQKSAPYTPQQNGTVERSNRTLMGITRSLMMQSNAPNDIWAEALMTGRRLYNATTPIRRLMTPFELFWGVKPDLSQLRVFGCKAYLQVPAHQRKKLDDRCIVGTMVGYSLCSKASRILIKQGSEYIVKESRDVQFDETVMGPFKDEQHEHDSDWMFEMIGNMGGEMQAVPPVPANVHNHQDEHAPILDAPGVPNAAMEHDAQPPAAALLPEAQVPDVQGQGAYDDMPGLEAASEISEEEFQDPNDMEVEVQHDAHDAAELPQPQVPQGRPQRNAGPPTRYGDFVAHYVDDGLTDEPKTLKEVQGRPDCPQWYDAMNTETVSMAENGIATVVDPAEVDGMHFLNMRWVFNRKRDELGRIEKYRARLVVKGFAQQHGVDYDEVYSPVSKFTTARFLMSQAVQHDLDMMHLDVKAAFMHSKLEEDVYVKPPPGHPDHGKIWKLNKALNGLKQASRAWFQHLKSILLKMGMTISHADESLYIFKAEVDGKPTYILVYVDDLMLAGSKCMLAKIYEQLRSVLQIVNRGEAKHFLGMEIIRDRANGTLWLGQSENAKKLLMQFGMAEAKGRKTPMDAKLNLRTFEGTADPKTLQNYQSLIGSLLYLANCTRPDLAQPVGVLARFMSNPSEEHMAAAKQVLRYLAGTMDMGIMFTRDGSDQILGYCDADYAGDLDKRRSTSGYVFLRSGGAISWSSKLQPTVALSTCEAEYISASHAAREALWLRNLAGEFDGQVKQIKIHVDNQGALKLIHHPHAHQRTKHIDVAYRFVQDRVERGELKCDYIRTDLMVADCLTKAVPMQKLSENVSDMGLVRRPSG